MTGAELAGVIGKFLFGWAAKQTLDAAAKRYLSNDKVRDEFCRSIEQGLSEFEKTHSDFVASFFDRRFVKVAIFDELVKLLERRGQPDLDRICQIYASQFAKRPPKVREAAALFLACVERAMAEFPILSDIMNARQIDSTYRMMQQLESRFDSFDELRDIVRELMEKRSPKWVPLETVLHDARRRKQPKWQTSGRSFSGYAYRVVSKVVVQPAIARLSSYFRWSPHDRSILLLGLSPEEVTKEALRYFPTAQGTRSAPDGLCMIELRLNLAAILDLMDDEVLKEFGADEASLIGRDWTVPRSIASSAYAAQLEGLLVPLRDPKSRGIVIFDRLHRDSTIDIVSELSISEAFNRKH